MPIISQILCDGCQAVKKQTNHWYTLVISDGHEACLRPMAMTPIELFQADAHGVQYFCGRRCVSEALDRWMDGLTALSGTDSRGGSIVKCQQNGGQV
jgi:hypothetical protein